MTDDGVRVVYRKYDGALHWHQSMRRLGEDAHGVWLGAPTGMVRRKGEDGPPVVPEYPQVLLFPADGWWTAAFNGAPSVVEIYVGIKPFADGYQRWLRLVS